MNAESILLGLIRRLGVEPEHLKQSADYIIQTVKGLRAEADAFKVGSANVVNAFSERLARIEAKQDEILALLNAGKTPPAKRINGAAHTIEGKNNAE